MRLPLAEIVTSKLRRRVRLGMQGPGFTEDRINRGYR
jgi:hypothetical protein